MSLLSFLLGAAEAPGARKRPAPAQTLTLRNGRSAVVIPRNTTPLYEQRGWKRKNGALFGHYRTPFGSFEGLVEGSTYYIFDPPQAVLDGEHGACFRQRGIHLFEIHWRERPKDISAGILHVEKCLMEALS